MGSAVLILNGPNLNMLGSREPDIYGSETLGEIEQSCHKFGQAQDMAIDFRQSNSETDLVVWIQEAKGKFDGLIINAGAYSHTSIAILDALQIIEAPVIEVHLSNIFKREPFRHESYVSRAAHGLICGFGAAGYELALDAMARLLKTAKKDG